MKTLIIGTTGTGKTFLAKQLLSDVKHPLIVFEMSSELVDEYLRVNNLNSLKYAIKNKLNIVIDIEFDFNNFKIEELKSMILSASNNYGYAIVFDEATNKYFTPFKDVTNSLKNFMIIAQDYYLFEKDYFNTDIVFDLNNRRGKEHFKFIC